MSRAWAASSRSRSGRRAAPSEWPSRIRSGSRNGRSRLAPAVGGAPQAVISDNYFCRAAEVVDAEQAAHNAAMQVPDGPVQAINPPVVSTVIQQPPNKWEIYGCQQQRSMRTRSRLLSRRVAAELAGRQFRQLGDPAARGDGLSDPPDDAGRSQYKIREQALMCVDGTGRRGPRDVLTALPSLDALGGGGGPASRVARRARYRVSRGGRDRRAVVRSSTTPVLVLVPVLCARLPSTVSRPVFSHRPHACTGRRDYSPLTPRRR